MKFQYCRISWWHAFIIGGCLLVLFHSNVLADREDSDNRNEHDPCINVHQGPNKKFKLVLVTIDGKLEICCGANPGQKIIELCKGNKRSTTKYADCEPGTYIADFAHNRTSCLKQKQECPPDQILIEGSSSIASRCDCLDRYYMTSEEHCQPHSSCLPGEGVDSLGSPYHDTKCTKCLHGYHSPSNSLTERCERIRKAKIQTIAAPATVASNDKVKGTTPATPPFDPPNQSSPSDYYNDYTIHLGFFIAIVVSYIAVLQTYQSFFRNKNPTPYLDEPSEQGSPPQSNRDENNPTSNDVNQDEASPGISRRRLVSNSR